MVWGLDKLKESYQESKRKRKVTGSSQKQLPPSDSTAITSPSLENLIVGVGAKITIEVLPRNPSEETVAMARESGIKDLSLNRVAILTADIDFPDGKGIYIPSYHELWNGSYEDYVNHITQVVRNLRRKGHKIDYRYFDRKLQRFVYENGITLQDYPRYIGSPQRKTFQKVVYPMERIKIRAQLLNQGLGKSTNLT
jgi:hypothetical protein